MSTLVSLWHHAGAWVLGPLLVGAIGVFLAIQGEYASNVNKLLFTSFPLAPLVILPAGFALISVVSGRFFPGTSGSGIPQAIAALSEEASQKNPNYSRFTSLSARLC